MSKLTNDQFNLLKFIGNTCLVANRRTDKLARNMNECRVPREHGGKWDNSHVPYIGLQLRELGYVTTFKDNAQYARWDVSAPGAAILLEETIARKKEADAMAAKKEGPVTVPQTKGFIVVSQSDSGEQSKILISKPAADKLAEEWAREEPGATYLVCSVLDKVKASVVVNKE